MRIALLIIGGDAQAAGSALLGKSVARRQLEFALAAGCDAAIVLGDGGGAEAIRLRHQAEAGGMKFRTMGNTHNLLGAVGTGDELLIIAPRLIPANGDALRLVGESRAILSVPADPGIALGFERIDSARAWAGVALLPGRLVEGLAQLPRDCDAAAALLRIALQAHLPAHALPPPALTDGSWIMARAADRPAIEALLLDRGLPRPPRTRLSAWLATSLMRRIAPMLLGRRFSGLALTGGTIALALGAAVCGLYGLAAPSLLLVALCAFMAELAIAFERVSAPALAATAGAERGTWLRWLADAALLACATLAIHGAADGAWHRAIFPPLVLLGALHATMLERRGDIAALLGDRALLALILAAAALAGVAEQAVMAAALAIVLLWAITARRGDGITRP